MNEVNNIPEGWVETTLGKVGKVITGKTPSKNNPEDWGDLVDFITPTEIKSENKYIFNCPRKLSKIGVERFSKMILPEKSVIVTCIGSDMGKVVLNKNIALANQQINSIVVNEKNFSNFIYYLLKNSYKILRKKAEGSGSTMPILNKSTFENLEFNIPKSIDEQKSIAAILTSFDDKIELLQAQNKTLEELAQTIFKEWFGKYQIGDELPEGWQVEELDGLLELVIDYRGKTPLKLGMDWSENGIPALSAKSIKNGKIVRRDAMNFGSEELYSIWMKDELKKGDILLTSEAPLGEMYYLNDDTRYILSQRLFALRVNQQITSEYLYHYLYSTNGQTLLQARASGSTVEGIRQSELRKIEVIVPDKNILEKASIIFKNVFDKTFANEQQIQTLTKTRDELLPKLMSGEIRVKMSEL